MQPETLVSAVNKAMRAHGYAMVSTAQPINFDGYAIRFVVAGDNVLAERLKPIVISGRGVAIIGAVNSVSAKLSQAAQLARQSDAETEKSNES